MISVHPTQYNPAIGNRLKDYIRYSEIKNLAYKIADLQRQGREFRSVAVLSFYPREGKTLFCAALAMAYAETARMKTLAVDATTYHRPKSLILRECIDPDFPDLEYLSLTELRAGSNGFAHAAGYRAEGGSADEPVRVRNGALALPPPPNDQSLVSKVAKDQSKQYGLVILDTSHLTSRNRNNVDPFLVARLSDASLLVASKKALDAPDSLERLESLDDPTLHLAGVISNEEFLR